MELITNVGASLLGMVVSVLVSILANDACKSADRICAKVIDRAAKRLAPLDQAEKLLEWQADLDERDTTFEKYRHAIGCFLAAGPMSGRGSQVILAMNIAVAGFGIVPLRFDAEKTLKWYKVAQKGKPFKLTKAVLCGMIIYYAAKFILTARRVNPAGIKNFKQYSDHKKWRYDVRAEHRGLSFDLNGIFNSLSKLTSDRPAFDAELQKFNEERERRVQQARKQ